jgi:hypothetical protein
LNLQISNFESTVAQIAGAVGAAAAAGRLARSILFVGVGSNDYLNNYLMPNYDTRRRYGPQQFADLLVRQYAGQLAVRTNELTIYACMVVMHYSLACTLICMQLQANAN